MTRKTFNHNLIPDWKNNDTAFYAKLFAQDTQAEYFRSRTVLRFHAFHSGHEGIGVIREEYLELEKIVFQHDKTPEEVDHMYTECVQIAAMALAFAIELVGPELNQFEDWCNLPGTADPFLEDIETNEHEGV